ncbi:MAG: site-2 protease family protein [Bacteroidota bacterium]
MTEQLYILPILLLSVVVHEVAHGYMALRLGDPTAKSLGRLTLNPLPHIDPIGSIFIPLFSLLTAGTVFIAWAKPVPVDASNFSRPRRDDLLVSIIGPGSNILMAFVCSVAVILLGLFAGVVDASGSVLASEVLEFLLKMFYGGIYLNIILAVFNLIPVPPLDGSHVLAAFLPLRLAHGYRSIGFAGILLLIFLMRVPWVNAAFYVVIRGIFVPFDSLITLFS